MEKYYLPNSINEEGAITFGYFVNKVSKKQENEYGKKSASKTKDSVLNIYKNCVNLNNSNEKNKNVLLVGKVQSGKTSNLELFTAFAFDNGYKCVVIYGGYDNKLLSQTCERFKKTFDINEETIDGNEPALFSTNESDDFQSLDEDVIRKIIEWEKPIILVSMKRPAALRRVNEVLLNLKKNNIKTFIIDDEGDQASLNTEFKKNKQSSTYAEISYMKDILNNPLYLSVTATPQANVLLGEYSILKPYKLFLIEPGNGYTGASFFHTSNKYIIYDISEGEIEQLDKNEVPDSLFVAINYFLLATIFMKDLNKKYSDMIIHTNRTNKHHKQIYQDIHSYIHTLKDLIKNKLNWNDYFNKIISVFTDDYFEIKYLNKYSIDELKNKLETIILDTHIILQDSIGASTQGNENYKPHKIYIGGDLLQRGLTFRNLICTYFTRWPKSAGNMDTTIQRARWFGYRSDYLELCKIFTIEKIKLEYEKLTESEVDLWEQCKDIQDGVIQIDDIVIDSNSSSLNPTRKNVVSYKTVKFSNKWTNQRTGFFDEAINKHNNFIIDELIYKLEFKETTIGRVNNDKISCTYAYLSEEDIKMLFTKTSSIFNCEPFNTKEILRAVKDKKVVLQRMCGLDGKVESYRERSFYPSSHSVLALQQGEDSADESKRKYLGDSKVIVDKDAVTIQMFKICPRFNKKMPMLNHIQYMFSIHMPESRKGFIRNDITTNNSSN